MRRLFQHKSKFIPNTEETITNPAQKQEVIKPEPEEVKETELPDTDEDIVSAVPLPELDMEEEPEENVEFEQIKNIVNPPGRNIENNVRIKRDSFVSAAINSHLYDDITAELEIRKKADPYINLSRVVEQRLNKCTWTKPETEGPLTDLSQPVMREYRNNTGMGKKVRLNISSYQSTTDNINDEYDYRKKHGEPNITKTEIIETRLQATLFQIQTNKDDEQNT